MMKKVLFATVIALTPHVAGAQGILGSIADALNDIDQSASSAAASGGSAPAAAHVVGAGACMGVDFGDNTSIYANDGECDDPRFEGPGVASFNLASDAFHDANDCRAQCQQGGASLTAAAESALYGNVCSGIDFGSNTSIFANDGECDDPRFEGAGVSGIAGDSGRMTDANDCSLMCSAGLAVPVAGASGGNAGGGKGGGAPTGGSPVSIQMGDDNGPYPRDGECDDHRFVGVGMAISTNEDNIMHDATDCQANLDAGTIRVGSDGSNFSSASCGNIVWGDDSSEWANNGICDDPRFAGPGTDPIKNMEDAAADASDCINQCYAGSIWPR